MGDVLNEEFFENVQACTKSRKQKRDRSKWKKNVAKRDRYDKRSQKEPRISCTHDDKVCAAKKLTPDDIKIFHDLFWEHKTAVAQRNFLSGYITVGKVKRRRPNQGRSEGHAKSISTKYSIQARHQSFPVCKQTLLSILNIGRTVDYVANKKFNNESISKENRGGARLSKNMILLQNKIEDHIKSFKCRSKHWGRGGAPNRQYLPSDLNIKKMWELFCSENPTDNNNKISSYCLYYKV